MNAWQNLPIPMRRLIIVSACVVLTCTVVYCLLFCGLPDADEIEVYRPESTVKITALNWERRTQMAIRIWQPLERISPVLQRAVIISEDDIFYQHDGVNYDMLKEAFKVNLQEKRYVRGASTITMQLARNAFLHKRKTLLRKVREIILARRIERVLSKRSILELYLNVVEWGENIYGAEAAARYYFGKPAAALNLTDASMLAAMLPNPKYFNPFLRLQSCRRMQKRVLRLLRSSRSITLEQYQSSLSQTIQLRGDRPVLQTAKIDSLEEAKYRLEDKIDLEPLVPIRDKPRLPLQLIVPDSSAVPDTASESGWK